mgnify:CR=1 FL=1
MPQYTPPLRDMQFVMHELLDAVSVLKAIPRHAEIDADTLNAVLEEGGKFTAGVVTGGAPTGGRSEPLVVTGAPRRARLPAPAPTRARSASTPANESTPAGDSRRAWRDRGARRTLAIPAWRRRVSGGEAGYHAQGPP